jgi:hypothetical protein
LDPGWVKIRIRDKHSVSATLNIGVYEREFKYAIFPKFTVTSKCTVWYHIKETIFVGEQWFGSGSA